MTDEQDSAKTPYDHDPVDVADVFELETHGPDVWIGESPDYPWGRIFGGLVIAQALWAATQTVEPEHVLHSMHSYFILGGDPTEPVRYEVDRLRNGRSVFNFAAWSPVRAVAPSSTCRVPFNVMKRVSRLKQPRSPSDAPRS